MACEDDSERKCFTFTWKIENVTYAWQEVEQCIESPEVSVEGNNWKLELNIDSEDIGILLQRQKYNGPDNIIISYEFAFLSADGKVLHAFESKNSLIEGYGQVGKNIFISRDEVFFARRSVFLPQDTLTARCRMWGSLDEISKDMQCFARTRIVVEKMSFMWYIERFSTLQIDEIQTYRIKSLGTGAPLMTLELFLTGGLILDEAIRFRITPDYRNMKISTLQVCVGDASKNTVKCFHDEFWIHDLLTCKEFSLFCTKRELMEQKSVYLPNDILSLRCECAFSLGEVLAKIDMADFDFTAVEKMKSNDRSLEKRNVSGAPKDILIEEFKSMLNGSDSLSDIKLKTSNEAYPAHKCILSVRSPVFKDMFSSDMNERINDCVDMENLNDDSVLRMLRYIYSAEVEELEWDSAIELYEAADKYQILNLKDICLSYLKDHLRLNNACKALMLADLHQDENLKDVVQDFIVRHGKDIINSEEWELLMETDLKLAAETMRLKFKE